MKQRARERKTCRISRERKTSLKKVEGIDSRERKYGEFLERENRGTTNIIDYDDDYLDDKEDERRRE